MITNFILKISWLMEPTVGKQGSFLYRPPFQCLGCAGLSIHHRLFYKWGSRSDFAPVEYRTEPSRADHDGTQPRCRRGDVAPQLPIRVQRLAR